MANSCARAESFERGADRQGGGGAGAGREGTTRGTPAEIIKRNIWAIFGENSYYKNATSSAKTSMADSAFTSYMKIFNKEQTYEDTLSRYVGNKPLQVAIRDTITKAVLTLPPSLGGIAGISFRNGGRVPRFGYGGFSTPGFDSQSVPAMLHGGEFVINAGAVKNIGMATLQTLNNMRFNKPDQISGQNATSHTSTSTTNIYVENFIGEDEWFNSMIKQYNMNVLPGKQKAAGMENRVISSYSGLARGR